MSWKTPLVEAGMLRERACASTIVVGSAEWFDWVAAEENCSFHFRHPDGEFTARKERKQRGQAYWVAYRQIQNKLYKRYLGKPDALTTAHLMAVAAKISGACPGAAARNDGATSSA